MSHFHLVATISLNINHVYINRCCSFKVRCSSCNEPIFFLSFPYYIPSTVWTRSMLLDTKPHVNRNHGHRKALTLVNSSRENHCMV